MLAAVVWPECQRHSLSLGRLQDVLRLPRRSTALSGQITQYGLATSDYAFDQLSEALVNEATVARTASCARIHDVVPALLDSNSSHNKRRKRHRNPENRPRAIHGNQLIS